LPSRFLRNFLRRSSWCSFLPSGLTSPSSSPKWVQLGRWAGELFNGITSTGEAIWYLMLRKNDYVLWWNNSRDWVHSFLGIPPRHSAGETEKDHEIQSKISRYFSRNSNRMSPEYIPLTILLWPNFSLERLPVLIRI
jgi:hypothetical protein